MKILRACSISADFSSSLDRLQQIAETAQPEAGVPESSAVEDMISYIASQIVDFAARLNPQTDRAKATESAVRWTAENFRRYSDSPFVSALPTQEQMARFCQFPGERIRAVGEYLAYFFGRPGVTTLDQLPETHQVSAFVDAHLHPDKFPQAFRATRQDAPQGMQTIQLPEGLWAIRVTSPSPELDQFLTKTKIQLDQAALDSLGVNEENPAYVIMSGDRIMASLVVRDGVLYDSRNIGASESTTIDRERDQLFQATKAIAKMEHVEVPLTGEVLSTFFDQLVDEDKIDCRVLQDLWEHLQKIKTAREEKDDDEEEFTEEQEVDLENALEFVFTKKAPEVAKLAMESYFLETESSILALRHVEDMARKIDPMEQGKNLESVADASRYILDHGTTETELIRMLRCYDPVGFVKRARSLDIDEDEKEYVESFLFLAREPAHSFISDAPAKDRHEAMRGFYSQMIMKAESRVPAKGRRSRRQPIYRVLTSSDLIALTRGYDLVLGFPLSYDEPGKAVIRAPSGYWIVDYAGTIEDLYFASKTIYHLKREFEIAARAVGIHHPDMTISEASEVVRRTSHMRGTPDQIIDAMLTTELGDYFPALKAHLTRMPVNQFVRKILISDGTIGSVLWTEKEDKEKIEQVLESAERIWAPRPETTAGHGVHVMVSGFSRGRGATSKR